MSENPNDTRDLTRLRMEETALPEGVGEIIAQALRPVMEAVGKLLENNTAALEQLSSAQSVQNDRLKALEMQIRLQTPVTGKQVSYINDAIRARARELLDKRQIDDAKATTKLGNAIRKAVLSRYGVSTLREVPKHEYNIALQQIGMWNDALTVRDVVKEARERADEMPAPAGRPAGVDGDATHA